MPNRTKLMAATALATAALAWGLVPAEGQQAQDTAQPRRAAAQPEAQAQPGARAQPGETAPGAARVSDQELATWLLIDNMGEIQLSQLALEQSENEQVKEFAEQMVQAHQQMVQQLQQVLGGQPGQPPEARPRTRPGAAREEQPGAQPGNRGAARNTDAEARLDLPPGTQEIAQVEEPAQPRRQPRGAGQAQGQAEGREVPAPFHGGAQGMPLDGLLMFHAQIGQQCVQNAQKQLQGKQGAEFDQAFMSLQAFLHQRMIDTLQVAQQHAQQPQFKQQLEQAEQSAQQHMEHAVALLREIDQTIPSGSQTGRRRGAAFRGEGQEQGEGSERNPGAGNRNPQPREERE